MKKLIKYTVLSLLAFLPAMAQNTATTSGNWDDCTTWGNPTSILQNNFDTKIINAGVTVAQNTIWSTKTVDFAGGNGAITFASSSNSIDFVADGGSDKTCASTPGFCGGAPTAYTTISPAISRVGVGNYHTQFSSTNEVYFFGTNVGYIRIVFNGVTYNLNCNPSLKYGKLGDPGVTGNGYILTISSGGPATIYYNFGCPNQTTSSSTFLIPQT